MHLPLIIFGAGSLARLAHYYATREMGIQVIGFAVDASRRDINELCGLPVFDWEDSMTRYSPAKSSIYVAVGYRHMRQREAIFERVRAAGYSLQNIIAKSAFIAETASHGDNNFIMPGVVIEPGVSMGSNNIIWSNVTICHDSNIGSHNFFASNVTIGGETAIGHRCFLGFSSTVGHQRRIGNDVLLAAHSLLLEDANNLSRYQGSPARKVEDVDSQSGVCVK